MQEQKIFSLTLLMFLFMLTISHIVEKLIKHTSVEQQERLQVNHLFQQRRFLEKYSRQLGSLLFLQALHICFYKIKRKIKRITPVIRFLFCVLKFYNRSRFRAFKAIFQNLSVFI